MKRLIGLLLLEEALTSVQKKKHGGHILSLSARGQMTRHNTIGIKSLDWYKHMILQVLTRERPSIFH